MTNTEIRDIQELQCRGLGYRRIASILNLPINTVKSYCQRHPVAGQPLEIVGGCKNCGADLGKDAARYKKQFCSDSCRMSWWNQHRYMVRRTAARQVVCEHCGRVFSVYGRPSQKFCSQACYQNHRKKVAE